MITRHPALDAFERAQLAAPVIYEANLRIFTGLLLEARALGVIPLEDPLEGLDTDLRLARVLNGRRPA